MAVLLSVISKVLTFYVLQLLVSQVSTGIPIRCAANEYAKDRVGSILQTFDIPVQIDAQWAVEET